MARFDDLAAFAAVVRVGSFTRAAAQMGVSQSALSQTVRSLEHRLNLKLLNRTTRSVSPTEAGERLYRTVGPRFADIEAELAVLGELRGKPVGTIRITATEHAVRTLIWPRLLPWLPKYPDIKIVAEPVADWLQSRARERMAEVLASQAEIDVVYGHNDPMAVGAYLAAKEARREKEMIFIGVDGLSGEAGGIQQVQDGLLAATFIYPLCVDKAVEIGGKIIRDPKFKPEKEYTLPSEAVTAQAAK